MTSWFIHVFSEITLFKVVYGVLNRLYVYIVLGTEYSVQRTTYRVLRTEYSVQSTPHRVLPTDLISMRSKLV